MYKELIIHTTHRGTTRGYYGYDMKKVLMQHQDLNFTETYFSTHLDSPVIVVG